MTSRFIFGEVYTQSATCLEKSEISEKTVWISVIIDTVFSEISEIFGTGEARPMILECLRSPRCTQNAINVQSAALQSE